MTKNTSSKAGFDENESEARHNNWKGNENQNRQIAFNYNTDRQMFVKSTLCVHGLLVTVEKKINRSGREICDVHNMIR